MSLINLYCFNVTLFTLNAPSSKTPISADALISDVPKLVDIKHPHTHSLSLCQAKYNCLLISRQLRRLLEQLIVCLFVVIGVCLIELPSSSVHLTAGEKGASRVSAWRKYDLHF